MVTNFNSRFGSNNWSITGVTLCVNEQGVPNNALFNRGVGAFEIFWITNDNWVEGTGTPNSPATTGINYDDEATLLSSGADLSLGTWTNAGVDGPLSFPLALPTGFVGDLRNGGEVGLYLTALDPGTGFTFMSRSFGTPSMQPVLEVSAASRPVITSIRFSGTDIVLTAANGVAGGTCCTLASTNVTLPLSQWTPVMTNVLATDGDFVVTLTNAVNAGTLRQQFFMLQAE
jgi:hypothetical protein